MIQKAVQWTSGLLREEVKKLDPNGTFIDFSARGLATMATLDAAYAWWKEMKKSPNPPAIEFPVAVERELFEACEKSFSPQDVQDYYEMLGRERRQRERRQRGRNAKKAKAIMSKNKGDVCRRPNCGKRRSWHMGQGGLGMCGPGKNGRAGDLAFEQALKDGGFVENEKS